MKYIWYILLAFLVFGCEAQVAEEYKNKVISCIDTRDGDKFSFNTNDITNYSTFGHDFSFNVIDNKKRQWTITQRSEIYLKCHSYLIK